MITSGEAVGVRFCVSIGPGNAFQLPSTRTTRRFRRGHTLRARIRAEISCSSSVAVLLGRGMVELKRHERMSVPLEHLEQATEPRLVELRPPMSMGVFRNNAAGQTLPRMRSHVGGQQTGRMKDNLFLVAVGAAILVSMTGWLYALGWSAMKLIQFI